MMYPTSPAPSDSAARIVGAKKPTSSVSNRVPWAIASTFSRARNRPSTTRTNATTPRYWSYEESKTRARAGACGIAARGRDALDDRVEHGLHALAGLRGGAQYPIGIVADELGQLAGDAVRIGLRQVDLVDDRKQLEVVLDREVGVRDGLRLDSLRGVDDEHGALARLERARDFVREVDVPGRVDEVQLMALPLHADRLGLDRDPPLALEVHRVEHLRAHVASGHGVRQLENAVGERRLAVVDVRDDREVADSVQVHGRSAATEAAQQR